MRFGRSFSWGLGGHGPLALWVECQGARHTLDSPASIDALLEDAGRWEVDALLVQVYRSGLAWYRSDKVDRAPAVTDAFDPLGYLLEGAARRQIAVQAWVNVFHLAENRGARILRELGDDVLTRDNYGRAADAYVEGRPPLPADRPDAPGEPFRIGTPGLWLDPGVESARQFQLGVLEEILAKYPGLSGIHLDFIRYPYAVPVRPVTRLGVGIDFGYAPAALEAFRGQTRKEAPVANENLEGATAWDAWRREQVTAFVEAAHTLAAKAEKKLSAAALAWADRAYLSAFQDWRGWIERGFLDEVVVMNYSRDPEITRHIGRASVAAAGASPHGKGEAWVGLGAYLFGKDAEGLRRQMTDASAVGAARIVLFSYDSIAENDELDRFLGQRARKVQEVVQERQEVEEFFESL